MVSPVQDIYAYKEEMTGIPFIKPVAYSAAKSGIYNLTPLSGDLLGKEKYPCQYLYALRRMARHPG